MGSQYFIKTIALVLVLAGNTTLLVTGASAQGYTLPRSTPSETFPEAAQKAAPWRWWDEDCTTYRQKRDQLNVELERKQSEQRWLHDFERRGIESARFSDASHINSSYDNATSMARFSDLQLRKDNFDLWMKQSEERVTELEKKRQEAIALNEAEYRQRLAQLDYRVAEDAKGLLVPRQQIDAANQAFNDCQKRVSEARKEPPMDEVLITQLLTALINETQLEQWERDLPAEKEKATKRRQARERIRQIEEKTERDTVQTHDPAASAVGAAILEGVISGAISGAVSRGHSGGGGGSSASNPPKTTGSCTGGVCRR